MHQSSSTFTDDQTVCEKPILKPSGSRFKYDSQCHAPHYGGIESKRVRLYSMIRADTVMLRYGSFNPQQECFRRAAFVIFFQILLAQYLFS